MPSKKGNAEKRIIAENKSLYELRTSRSLYQYIPACRQSAMLCTSFLRDFVKLRMQKAEGGQIKGFPGTDLGAYLEGFLRRTQPLVVRRDVESPFFSLFILAMRPLRCGCGLGPTRIAVKRQAIKLLVV